MYELILSIFKQAENNVIFVLIYFLILVLVFLLFLVLVSFEFYSIVDFRTQALT